MNGAAPADDEPYVNDFLWDWLRTNGTLDERLTATIEATHLPMDIARVVRKLDADLDRDRLVWIVRQGRVQWNTFPDYTAVLAAHQPERVPAIKRKREDR